MGLTWIDHDTIDKPVEEFADCHDDEEIKDIEFTVTTLNCHQQHGDENASTPEHQRGSSRLSFKKTGALGKVVRSKLTKTLYNSMDSVKPSRMSLKLQESHGSDDMDDKSPTGALSQNVMQTQPSQGHMSTPSSTSSTGTEKSKKRSKLCSLL